MTSVTTRLRHKGPLKDKTNVLNMKSRKTGNNNKKGDAKKQEEVLSKVVNYNVATRSRENAGKENKLDNANKSKQGKKLLKGPQNTSSIDNNKLDKPTKSLKVVLTDVLAQQHKSLLPQKNQISSQQKKWNGDTENKDTKVTNKKHQHPSEADFNKRLEILLTDCGSVCKKRNWKTRSKSVSCQSAIYNDKSTDKPNQPNVISNSKRQIRNRSKSVYDEKDTSKNGNDSVIINSLNVALENIDWNISKNNLKSVEEQNEKTNDLEFSKNGDKFHVLRRLQPKNYLDESSADSKTEEEQTTKAISKENKLPIYKQLNSKEMETHKQKGDEYEFDDFSPKAKAVKKRIDRSSILFDKDMYEIVKKLEGKEAKEKKRREKKVIRRKKKIPSDAKKSYEKIVKDILLNVKGKILERNRNKVENPPQALASNVTHRKNIQEVNVLVHQEPQKEKIVPEVKRVGGPIEQEKSKPLNSITTRKPINLNNIEICLDERGSSPINDDVASVCSEPPGIDECFGFDFEAEIPNLSTPNPHNKIQILSHQVINSKVESPVNFTVRPNFNSTMIDFGRSSSPWRTDALNITRNPHFVSVKSNGLPRIDQEMVLESTFVEDFESHCTKTPSKEVEVAAKKAPVQQSILNYIESNVEHVGPVLERSLFDYEEFISPVKRNLREKENKKANQVKRNLLGDKDEDVIASTPIQRKVLGDISNSPETENNASNKTYFGFENSSVLTVEKSPEKTSKPYRFDPTEFRSYASKKNKQQKQVEEIEEAVPDVSGDGSILSLMETSKDVNDLHLFEEPEEILDNMSPVIGKKKRRRKRLDSSDSDNSDCGKKHKKHKKTKLEIEQEKWISDFNQMCEETDQHELELV